MNNKDDKDDKDNHYYFNDIVNTITNYLIDNDIIITDNDTYDIKLKKYVLKYKRIIGIICLIILLIIGYYCDPLHLYYKDDSKDLSNNLIQSGGFSADEKARAKVQVMAEQAQAKAAKAQKKADKKADKSTKKETMAAKGEAKMEKHAKGAKNIAKKATSLKTNTGAISGAADATGKLISNNADLVVQIFYSIALFILICIVTIPAIAFVVVGLLCYVLLKPKIEGLKAL